jgi:chromosome segregation ATPase
LQGQLEAAQQEKSGIVKEKEEVDELLKKEKEAGEQLTAKLLKEQESHNNAKAEVTRLTLDNAQLPDLRNKNATLGKNLKAEKLLTEKLEAEKKELAVKSHELDRLRQEITTHTDRIAELEGQVNTLKEEAEAYIIEIQGLEEALEECQKASHPD